MPVLCRNTLVMLLIFMLSVAPTAEATEYSRLWGKAGELWSAASRLPDFSYAGYRHGEKPLPDVPRGASVKDFGAIGDGETDDSDAFLKALAEVQSGAIEIPEGRYRITKILEITRLNIVLRGAGPDKTVLFFPTPLNDIKPNWGATTGGQSTSNYSWAGGFVWLRGNYRDKKLSIVTGAANRGDNAVTVAAVAPFRVGQQVMIHMSDTEDNSLARHLYSEDSGPVEKLLGKTTTSLVCRITGIEGERLTFDRPLRFDIRPEWKPEVRAFEPTVTESGVENLTFEFPVTDYAGHFTELGFNPVALSNVAHCWVRNIRIVNPDSGPMVTGHFNTLQGLVYESSRTPDKGRNQGHHGVYLGGADNVFTDFDIRLRFIHDLSVSRTAGNVISRGRGVDLCFDHHRSVPYENLFTDIDAGAGMRLWNSGGGAALGKHSAARGTFWNIRAARPLEYPKPGFGPPSMNLVGLHTTQPSVLEREGKWFEAIPPAELFPQNLYEAQLARRLGRIVER